MHREIKDKTRKALMGISSITAIAALFGIYYYLVKESLPAIRSVGAELFLSDQWYPVWEPAEFGMRALIINSIIVTALGTLIVVPIAYFMAIYLHGFASKKEKSVIRRLIEYLSGIPSVIIAFVFLTYLSPVFPKLGIYSPQNLLLALIGLFFLTIPISTVLILESLDNVPRELEEASAALGALPLKTYTRITTKAALPGVLNAIVLTANRIVGETIVVLLLGGGAAMVPRKLTDPMKTLTAAIASEMPEAARFSLHYSALFFAGLVLIIFSTIFELTSVALLRRSRK
ncbi:phosphate ABC transporter membrane protein 1, PhoT family [Fervidobacterium changbaicum]|uniref:Phosphate ABC transporter permease n=1 Tax=Fervidobacterium changbaicum TaxID=310769 RepID=A0AAE6CE42_9BACT|nr:ABC transporter permease subunit [Fervidobacterium changbaicum]QAV33399.1 phosphate ABC transporter permease [Fervidobacterium changbaicum]SDG91212.1 phosphate ABC transporter membrane protein 1, PhoT family [Fervidobacterium changbaicum]